MDPGRGHCEAAMVHHFAQKHESRIDIRIQRKAAVGRRMAGCYVFKFIETAFDPLMSPHSARRTTQRSAFPGFSFLFPSR
jgi:hypothetical protein